MKLAIFRAFTLLAPLAAASAGDSTRGAASARREEPMTYDGHHVFRIGNAPRSLDHELEFLHAARSGADLDVVVPPEEIRAFLERDLNTELLHEDFGELIRKEAEPRPYKRDLRKRGDLPDLSWYDSYHPYDDHLQYWKDLQAAFPNNSKLFDVGPSYEGRMLFGLQLWGNKGEVGNKPVVLWHGTVHAREWITTMVVEYLTYQLINGYKTGGVNATTFLDEYDFYIVPFHNPDGFVYTQTTNRLWRKNRQPRRGTDCIGTDGNRNWNYQWNYTLEDGSVSANPCGETFKGRCPGDTPENIALVPLTRSLSQHPKGIRLFVDWHSYSQLILLPWGWSCEPELLPENLPRQREVGAGYAAAIFDLTGQTYEVGPSCEILYYSTGSARDYHKGVWNATFSWSVELRPRTSREGGFVLLPEFIRPTAEEHWAGIQWVLNDILKGE